MSFRTIFWICLICQYTNVLKAQVDTLALNKDIVPDTTQTLHEELPRFPGCEELNLSKTELKKCAERELINYVYSGLEYPKNARENGIEGFVVVTFVVEADGSIAEPEIIRDIGGNCGKAVLKMIESMNAEDIVWRPGMQDGKAVRVKYTLPVKFSLERNGNKKKKG